MRAFWSVQGGVLDHFGFKQKSDARAIIFLGAAKANRMRKHSFATRQMIVDTPRYSQMLSFWHRYGAFCGRSQAFWGVLGSFWGVLGGVLEHSGDVLEHSGDALGHSGRRSGANG